VVVFFEELEECFAHFGQRVRSLCGRVSEEGVEAAFVAAGFAACFLLLVLGPVVFAAFWAELPHEALLFEEWKRVLFRWKPCQLSKHSVRRVTSFTDLKDFA
jgi:hypothetical protein